MSRNHKEESCIIPDCNNVTRSKVRLCVEHRNEALRVLIYIGMAKEDRLKIDDLI